MHKDENIYLDFLSLAYELLCSIRRSGVFSIENIVEYTDISDMAESDPVKSYPEIMNYPQHLEFMLDIFRQMVSEPLFKEGDLSRYAQNAKNVFIEGIPNIDAKLFDCIWECISTHLRGYPPTIAVESARQLIPFNLRPSYLYLEAYVKERRGSGYIDPAPLRNIDDSIEELVSSFDR